MRNDLVHTGCLSFKKNRDKSKEDCSEIIADTLNWIDIYVVKVLNISTFVSVGHRWKVKDIEYGLPSISL